MNPTILGVIGPEFLNQVPTLGRMKDPLYKEIYFGITPPAFIPPLEPCDTSRGLQLMASWEAPQGPGLGI